MPRLSHNTAIIETAEPAAMTALLASGLERMTVRRLSDRAVVVDHERIEDVRKLLRRLGHTPRITRE